MRSGLIIVIGTVAVRLVDAKLCSRHAFHSVIGCYLPDDTFLAFKPKNPVIAAQCNVTTLQRSKAFFSFYKIILAFFKNYNLNSFFFNAELNTSTVRTAAVVTGAFKHS